MTGAEVAELPERTARVDDSSQIAYDLIRRDILMGRLAPGEVLSQVQVASRLGISRTPLREALRRLSSEGLVAGDFNRRMRVSELDLHDFDQIYAMRFALEPIGVRATLPVLTALDFDALHGAIASMDEAIDSRGREAFRDAHRDFHLVLTAYAGERLHRTLADLWDHSERYRLRYLHREGPDDDGETAARLRLSQVEHRSILEAALGRDAELTTRRLVEHLHRTLDAVFLEAEPVPPRLSAPRAGAGR